MGDTLAAVWEQVTDLLSAGVSIIPVRDRERDGRPPKSPYTSWKQFQSRIITPEELWRQMEQQETTAIAIICGAVSGNLEAIDIDVKNWAGIDARLFEAIRELYPDLFARLRIHSTPSGGFHILYRVQQALGVGNQKLATASHSTQAGIETRGEGGYIVAPPSLGYRVYKDVPIPIITLEQRNSIIALAKSWDEKIKIIDPPRPPKQVIDYYEEKPTEAFDHSPDAEEILGFHGWQRDYSNSHHQYWIRPGKSMGIGASFNLQSRVYYIFTSSTSLEPNRGYRPSTLLLLLQFNGDRDACYKYLIDKGYGKIRKTIERTIVNLRVITGKSLPANASDDAKKLYVEKRSALETKYPHGLFWILSDKEAVSINREKLYHVAGELGFRISNGQLVKIDGYIARRVTDRLFYDTMKNYIGSEEKICNAFESFIQKAGEFTQKRIPLLDENLFVRSSKDFSYKFFRNGFVSITKKSITFEPYTDLIPGRLVWENQVADREITLAEIEPGGLYYQFLHFAIGITSDLWRVIGYLCHEHKDEATGYLIILTESCPDPKQGGGTGKNIFTNLIGCSTSLKNLAGSQVQLNEKFLQAWNYERVLAVHDINKNFPFGFMKELATGAGTLKKLFKDEVSLTVGDMPKLVFTTNFSFIATDGGLKRRIVAVEFGSFFTQKGGVDVYFGKLFPYDWSTEDWNQYDNVILRSIQHYLQHDGKLEPKPLTEDGWLKQYDQMHMQLTREFIQQNWDYWLRVNFISMDQFRTDYSKFCTENNVDRKFALSSMRMHTALEDWANHYRAVYVNNYIKRDLVGTIRGRYFQLPEAPF